MRTGRGQMNLQRRQKQEEIDKQKGKGAIRNNFLLRKEPIFDEYNPVCQGM